MNTETAETKSTLKELAEIRAQVKSQATGKKEDLPSGSAPVEEPDESVEPQAASAENGDRSAEETPAPKVEEPEELIRIGDQTFKTQAEAIAYAERLEHEKMLVESYNQGIRETLQATQRPTEVAPPPEDNFDEQFYTNPKEALMKMKEQAKAEAIAIVDAREREVAAWNKFASLNPDLADSRTEVMRILQENWDVLGKMKDETKAMGILATKTRSYFQSIADRLKPRVELPNRPAQVVSPGGSSRPSVTPTKKDAAPLTMAEQLKSMRRRT